MIRIAIPYLFAASGAWWQSALESLRLTLEGFMLSGAFCRRCSALNTRQPWIGVLTGMLVV